MKVTERLLIRPLEFHDHENWRQAYTMMRPALSEWDESPWKESQLTKLKFRELVTAQRKLRKQDRFYAYGVFLKDDGVLIGFVDIMDVSRGRFQNAFLGYRIFNPYWGNGFASEAARAAVEIAFRDLKLHRIEAGIEPHNKTSIKVAKSIGLRKEGLSPKRLWSKGRWIDLLIYAATTEDFGIKYKIK